MAQDYYQCDEETYDSSAGPDDEGPWVTRCEGCGARKTWTIDDLPWAMEYPFMPCGCHWDMLQVVG